MVRENIAMIVEEINRPLNVAIAHLKIWECGGREMWGHVTAPLKVAIAHMMRATCEVGM